MYNRYLDRGLTLSRGFKPCLLVGGDPEVSSCLGVTLGPRDEESSCCVPGAPRLGRSCREEGLEAGRIANIP